MTWLKQSRVGRFGLELLDRWKGGELVDVAAGITYWTLLSIFPALLAFTALLGFLGDVVGNDNADKVRQDVIDFIQDHIDAKSGPIAKTVIDILSTPRGGLAAVGVVIAVWSMSKGFAGLFRGLCRVYGQPGARNNLLGRAIAVVFGLATVTVLVVLLLSMAAGPLLGFERLLPQHGGVLVTVFSYVRWPFIAAGVVAWLALLLSVGPGTGVRWRDAIPGAVFSAVGWVVITIGFAMYLRVAGGANPIYGVLGGIIVALTWLHLLVVAMLLGGVVNAMRWAGAPAVEPPSPTASSGDGTASDAPVAGAASAAGAEPLRR